MTKDIFQVCVMAQCVTGEVGRREGEKQGGRGVPTNIKAGWRPMPGASFLLQHCHGFPKGKFTRGRE